MKHSLHLATEYTIRENLHILKIYMSFRSCHFFLHSYNVTYYFLVFDWKNSHDQYGKYLCSTVKLQKELILEDHDIKWETPSDINQDI